MKLGSWEVLMVKKVLIILVTCAITIPVFAVDWEIYGRACFKAWFVKPDYKDDRAVIKNNPDERSYLDFGSDGGGLGLKIYHDSYEGRIHFGYGSTPDFGIILKHAWLKWAVTDIFGFIIGQTMTPMAVFPSNMTSAGKTTSAGNWFMLNCGLFYTGIRPQLLFEIKNLSVALIVPFVNHSEEDNVEISILGGYKTSNTLGTRLFNLPKVEAAFNYKAESWSFNTGVGIQYYQLQMNDLVLQDWEGDTVGKKRFDNVDIISAVVNADLGINLNLFYANLAVSGGFNYGAYGCKNTTNVKSVYQIGYIKPQFHGRFIDEITYGGVLTVGLKINEFIKPECGVGVVSSSRDARYYNEGIGKNKDEHTDLALRVYIQSNIMSPNEIVTFTPEIGYADELTGNHGQEEMKTIFAGCYISADF